MGNKKSFTLIELLVVISIIGLFSSIVLVATKGARDRARVAKALDFSQSVQTALGSEAVGVWNFDENSGTVAKDSSGYNNNGTLHSGAAICSDLPTAGCPTWTDDTPQKVIGQNQGKYALNFDGVDDYVDIGAGKFDTVADGTIEAWFKYSGTSGQNRIIFGHGRDASNRSPIFVSDSTQKIAFEMIIGGVNHDVYSDNTVSVGIWHHVAVTFGAGGIKMYINGIKQTDTDLITWGYNSIGVSVWNQIGIENGFGSPFNGFIDEVRVYSKALTIGEIQQHYVEGLVRLYYRL